ncbi:Paraquat-inducible protein B [Olavius sp. associated proteobacterium Delta 1]|nr:Paraquat-inducible protein B [Olavius sp. associated proteobacterium Delta 1]
MSKQANKTLIGVFVVVAIAMLVAAVLIFGSGKFFKEKHVYVAYFDGSVKGLRVGAPVVFRGVRIGEVNDIALHYYRQEFEFKIPVMITLYPDKIVGIGMDVDPDEEDYEWKQLLDDGFRATLEMQSIVTGQLLIGLDFHKDAPLKLQGLEELKLGPQVREIPTIKSGLQLLGKKIEQLPLDEIAADLRSSLRGLNDFVNSPEFGKSLHYFKQTMREARNLIINVNKGVDPLFAQLDQTLLDAQKLLRDVDGQIDPLATSLKGTSDDAGKLLRNVNKRIGPLQADLNKTTARLRSAFESAESALDEIDTMVDDESDLRYYIDIFLRELTLAARSIRALADYLERNPDALLRGKVSKANQKEGK